jgi:glycosyltransferase involved in cell wall biosynthesis
MKILRIANVPDNHTGGMSRAMYGTSEALQEAGHDVVHLFSNRLPQFHFIRVSVLRRLLTALSLPLVIRRTQRREGIFDIIEIHEPIAAFACLFRNLSSGSPPIVVFSHGLEERSFKIEVEYRKRKNQTLSFKERISSLLTVAQSKFAVHSADHVLCCNSQDVNFLEQQGVSPEKITRHFNGIEFDYLNAGQTAAIKRAGKFQSQRAILFVGTWQERKGIATLVPALNTVLQAYPDATFTAAGCGGTSDHILNSFGTKVRSRVQVIPYFEGNTALTELYQVHNIFVLPSIFEGQPLVMIEAAAFGLALVTTNVCGMIDFIKPESNGLLVPVSDEEALTAALIRLCNDRNLVQSLGNAAQVSATKQTWQHSAQNIFKAYQKTLAR